MNRKLALGLLLFINTLWGSSYVVTKVALKELPPPLLGALRFTLATGLIWLMILWQTQRGIKIGSGRGILQMQGRDALKLVALGLCGISLSYLLSYWGISLTTASDAALLIVCEVIFTSLLALIILGERLGRWKGLGIIIGIPGVVILILSNVSGSPSGNAGTLRALGDLLIMGGLFCQALFSVFGTGLAHKYQPLTMLAVVHTGSLLVWLPLLLWYIFAGRFPAVSITAVLGVVYLATVISVVCFFIWFSVLRAAGANLGAVSLLVQPLVGALLGITLLGEPVTTGLCIGALFIFIALYLTAIPSRQTAVSQKTYSESE